MRMRIQRSFAAAAAAVALLAVAGRRARSADRHEPAAAERAAPRRQLRLDGADDRRQHARRPTATPATARTTAPGRISCPTWSATPPVAPAPNRWNMRPDSADRLARRTASTASPCRARPGSDLRQGVPDRRPVALRHQLLPAFHRLVGQDTSGGAGRAPASSRRARLPGAPPGRASARRGDGHARGQRRPTTPPAAHRRAAVRQAPAQRRRAARPDAGRGRRLPAVPGRRHHLDARPHALRPDDVRLGPRARHRRHLAPNVRRRRAPFHGDVDLLPRLERRGQRAPTRGSPVNCTARRQMLAVGRAQPGGSAVGGAPGRLPRDDADLATQEKNNDEISERHPRDAPLRRDADGRHVRGRAVLLLDRPDRARSRPTPTSRAGAATSTSSSSPTARRTSTSSRCCSARARRRSARRRPLPRSPPVLADRTAATLYANGLSTATQASVKTYVIGFARLGFADERPRQLLAVRDRTGTCASQCNCNDPNLPTRRRARRSALLRPAVHRAQRRDQPRPTSPTRQGELQNALGAILANIAKNTTTRTVPGVLARRHQRPLADHDARRRATSRSSWPRSTRRRGCRGRATSSGSATSARTRTAATPSPRPTSPTPMGDDFAVEPQLAARAPPRTFIAFQPDDRRRPTTSTRPRPSVPTWRPRAATASGSTTATMYAGRARRRSTPHITYQAHGTSLATAAPYTSNVNGAPKSSPPAKCATMLLDYTFAQQSFSGEPVGLPLRLARTATRSASIYHATPTVVGPPGSLLQDPGYIGFASSSALDVDASLGAQDRRLRRDQRRPPPRLLGRRDEAGEQRAVGDAPARR